VVQSFALKVTCIPDTILLVKKAHTSRKVNLSTSSKNKNKNIFEKISKSISK
jgi:hypothetical protein